MMPRAVVMMPRAVVMMSGTSREHEKRLLRGVMVEALEAQQRKRTGLEEQLERTEAAPLLNSGDEKAVKAHAKALRRAAQVPVRLSEVDAAETKLAELQTKLRSGGDVVQIRLQLELELGLTERLASFDVDAMAQGQWGRPAGFDGLVLESPRGVPILVARQSFSDDLLRRVSSGTDLWFQVSEGRGSRVLLRTSMVRSLVRSPRECMETASDLAALFSDARRSDEVKVMYTDSRHVAKRGGRVGQLKESKRLGVIWAKPARVVDEARDAQEEQGWL